MMSNHDERKAGQGYAPRRNIADVKIRPIAWFIAGLTIATIVIFWLMAGLLGVFERGGEKADLQSKPSPMAAERQKLPPEPRLQLAPGTVEQAEGKAGPNLSSDHPLEEIQRFKTEEEQKLSTYGWVDQKSGIARIPIEEAKKLVLKRGLK